MLTFAGMRDLTDAEVEALLDDAEPPVRVWALWTIALRRQAAVADSTRMRLAQEPDPGVRRHLLLVLAGLGQRSAESVLRCVQDPDWETRRAAYTFLFASHEEVGAALLPRLLNEEEADLRGALVRWFVDRGRLPEVLAMAGGASEEAGLLILRDLDVHVAHQSVSWEVLAPLARSEGRELALWLALWLVRGDAHLAVDHFLGLGEELAAFEDATSPEQMRELRARWRYHEFAEDVLLEGIAQKGWSPAPERLRAQLQRFSAAVERVDAYRKKYDEDWEDEEGLDPALAEERNAAEARRRAALRAALGEAAPGE